MTYFPPAGFYFRVDFGLPGLTDNDVRFQEVMGLSAEVDVEEIAEGGENRFTHRVPVRAKYGNLVLKRGLLSDSGLIGWIENAIQNLETVPGQFEPTTVDVKLLDADDKPIGGAYSFLNAWPVKWSLGDLKATDNAVAVETLELSYSYLRLVKAS